MDPSAFSSLVPPVSLPPYAQQPPNAGASTASTSASAAGTTDAKNRRLPKEALAILHNFWDTVGDRPNNEQKEDILRQLSTIPGTEWYTRDHIVRYFSQRRVAESARRKKSSALSQAQRQFWPSLDNTKIQSLRRLYEEKRHPNKKVIALWAQSLNAEIAHIEAWLAYQSDDDDDDDNMDTDDTRERTHLPTPEATASPEPSFVKMGNSPTIPPVQSPSPFVTSPPFAAQPSPTNRYFSPTGHPYPPSVYYSKMQPPPHMYQVPQPTQSQLPSPVSPVAPVPPSPLKAAPWSPELKPALVSPVETIPAPQAPRLATPTSAPVSEATSPALAPVASPQEVARRRLKSIALNVKQRMEVDDVSSLSEYDAKAAVLEREGEDFLHKVMSGRFASLGLTADMVPSREDIEAQLRCVTTR